MPKLMMGTSAIAPATVFNIESVPMYIPLTKNYTIDSNGTLTGPAKTTYETGMSVVDIGDSVLESAFANNSRITSAVFTNISNISGTRACMNMFRNANNLAVISFPELESITGQNALYRLCITEDDFSGSSVSTGNKIESLVFPKLKTVTGNYACYQMFGYYGWSEDPSQGPKLTTVDLSALEVASGNNCFDCCFQQLGSITSIDIHNLKIAGPAAFMSFVTGNYNLTGEIHLDNLILVDSSSFASAFMGSNITKFTANALTSITKNFAFNNCFSGCSSLSVIEFNNLETIDISAETPSPYGSVMSSMCGNCTSLRNVTFPKLSTINGSKIFTDAFYSCTSLNLSFPSLTSTSFGSYTNQFNNMLERSTNCTVHFPSNLQSVIGSWSDVINGFGGTSTTVLFDLPATE